MSTGKAFAVAFCTAAAATTFACASNPITGRSNSAFGFVIPLSLVGPADTVLRSDSSRGTVTRAVQPYRSRRQWNLVALASAVRLSSTDTVYLLRGRLVSDKVQSKQWFDHGASLILRTDDGEEVHLDGLRTKALEDASTWMEEVEFPLPLQQLRELLAARRLAGEFGRTRVELDAEALRAMRQVLPAQ